MGYEKLVKDGKVAVLVSPGFGSGWYTQNHNPALLFDRELIEPALKGDMEELKKIASRKYPDVYQGGLREVYVDWVPQGALFDIHEYDGSESLKIISMDQFLVA